MGHADHKEKAAKRVTFFVITVSDTRTPETDESGGIIRKFLTDGGHIEAGCRIVPDAPEAIEKCLNEALAAAEAVIFNGGTGISKRDTTFEAIVSKFDKSLPGFGELFRMLSYEEIGSAAIMSRAAAGVISGRAVFMIPGSAGAVSLAMEKIIGPELAHVVWEAGR